MAVNIGNPKQLEQSIINRIKKDLFFKAWRKREDFTQHANSINSNILQYGLQVLDSIAPVLKSFAETHAFVHKLTMKNTGNRPALKFFKEIQVELGSLVPVDFPEFYTFDRMKELPRYIKALALRAERGSLNLASAEKKMKQVMIYSEKLQQILTPEITSVIPAHTLKGTSAEIQESDIDASSIPSYIKNRDMLLDYSAEKKNLIEELFWMIEEYKVSLFAQELKTPYPVSPKKLSNLINEIENAI